MCRGKYMDTGKGSVKAETLHPVDISFSIVICTYNGEKTLSNVLDAVLNLKQFDELLQEVIVVDNASNDSTKAIILSYVQKNKKIKYQYECVPGLSNARRHAISATAPWVIYVDDDNILESAWLVELKKTIENNPKAGVVNGAVIGIPLEQLCSEEEIRLQTMYHHLACTHIYKFNNIKTNTEPMGAGMCVITKALQTIADDGWLSLSGRTGSNLASGEDTELCNKVFSQGYQYICNYKMQMQHLIPRERLSAEYTARLLAGLTQSRYAYISNYHHYIWARITRLIRHLYIYLYTSLYKTSDIVVLEKNRQKKIVSKTFIKCVLNDYLIRK